MGDLFSDAADARAGEVAPLAQRLRPETLSEFVGQEHILGEGSALRRAIEEDRVHSSILYGPPGSGKTTLARIVAASTGNFGQGVAFAHLFHRPDVEGGFVIGAFGAGGVTSAFFLAGRVGTARWLSSTTLVLGAGMVAFALVPSWWTIFVPLYVAGFGYLSSVTAASARLQLEVDDHQRGRMMALWAVAFLGSRPFASLVDGALAHAFGVRVAAFVLALPALAAAAALMSYRKLRVS